VIGPQCDPARELVELGCPPISPGT
jgi:hypothetical protein